MRCKYCGKEVGEFYSQLAEHLWAEHREIMMKFLNKQVKKEDKRCGNCRWWSRGGIGAGRGGGYCLKWNIPKHPQNRHHADDCWEPKRTVRTQ